MSTPPTSPRVDFPQAIVEVLATLKKVPSISISGLAKATGIDRRTVTKAIDLIMSVQDSLATAKINRRKEGKMWVISRTHRTVEFFQSAINKVKRRGMKH
ncbi:MAG: hypothetical protein ACTSSE_17045 [Candidatus Thorarchaeota archaeon]